jgi:hypothetical protein
MGSSAMANGLTSLEEALSFYVNKQMALGEW